jgi:branched-chain amino acid transport system ATP-binding protein
VEENLVIGGERSKSGPWTLETIYELFPILREKRKNPGTALSGGQQQMVAIGRALMANPDLILFDEISLGLAPVVIRDIYTAFPRITATGVSIILVEQDVTRALATANRFVCMQEGKVSLAGEPDTFSRAEITAAYFGT